MAILQEDGSEIARWAGPYIKKVPKDPWDASYVYRLIGREFEIVSYGADGLEGGDGVDADVLSSE